MVYIKFSINMYDQDGDCVEEGIFIHFGDTRIKIGETLSDLTSAIKQMEVIKNEIKQYYPFLVDIEDL